jgi:hypothetical protein
MMTRRNRIVFGVIWAAIFLAAATWLGGAESGFWRLVSGGLYLFAAASVYNVLFGGSDIRCPSCGTKGKHQRDRNSEATARDLDVFFKMRGQNNPLSGLHYTCNACLDGFSESASIVFAEMANKYGEEFALKEYQDA